MVASWNGKFLISINASFSGLALQYGSMNGVNTETIIRSRFVEFLFVNVNT